LVGQNLLQQKSLTETIRKLSMIKDPSGAFIKALSVIGSVSNQQKSSAAEKELNTSLKIIENESPGILSRLAKTIEGIPANIAANLAMPWVQAIIASVPK